MRKQTKILVATALFTLGASFTSMAAAKTGTWVLENDGWYCYDADGDAYENEFCLSYGKEYYVGDGGLMVTNSWVEDEDGTYYVGSTGAKTINDWRFVTPEDEEDEDEEWFYFGSKGKMVTGKKVIGDKTYYFNGEGVMLSGWVDVDAMDVADEDTDTDDLVYCHEDGSRASKEWINIYEPGTDEDDIEDADTYWYWIKAKGAVQTGKNNAINGETYYFANDGKMLYGWVLGMDANGDGENDTFELTTASNACELGTVYFCGNDDQGWAKKNKWIKTWAPNVWEDADSDNTQYWYWINKNGEVYAAATDASDANAVDFVDGEDRIYAPGTENVLALKEIDKKTYAFKSNGQMWSGLVDVDGMGMYYFGGSDDGAMKTGSVKVEDEDGYEYEFFFGENDKNGYIKGVAVTGNADGELYVNGQLVKADNGFQTYEVEELDVTFLIDEDGDIRTFKKKYYDDDDNLELDATVDGFDFNDEKGPKKGSY